MIVPYILSFSTCKTPADTRAHTPHPRTCASLLLVHVGKISHRKHKVAFGASQSTTGLEVGVRITSPHIMSVVALAFHLCYASSEGASQIINLLLSHAIATPLDSLVRTFLIMHLAWPEQVLFGHASETSETAEVGMKHFGEHFLHGLSVL